MQTLETAADVSLQIAAMPDASRHALTERFMHKNVKHDITVDPNTANPFASFSDHSKGEDAGSIVEAVAGVIINIVAAFVPVLAPLAIAWDVAEAGKSFSQGNILGGFLNLAAAVGAGVTYLGSAAAAGSEAAQATSAVAQSLGYTGGAVAGATLTVPQAAAATQAFGQTILAGTALVGGAAGIAQSAERGDGLGIVAGLLEVAAAVAGGLLSTGEVSAGTNFGAVLRGVAVYGGIASLATSGADAFIHGDIAGGLASSLNALEQLIGTSISHGDVTDTLSRPGETGSSVDSVYQEDLPPPAPPAADATTRESFAEASNPDSFMLVASLGDIALSPVTVTPALLALEALGFIALIPLELVAGGLLLTVGALAFFRYGVSNTFPVQGYEPDQIGVAPVSAEINARDGTVLIYRGSPANGPDINLQTTATLTIGAEGVLYSNQGDAVGYLRNGAVVLNEGVTPSGLLSGPTANAPTSADPTPNPPLISPSGQTGSPPGPERPDGQPINPDQPSTQSGRLSGDVESLTPAERKIAQELVAEVRTWRSFLGGQDRRPTLK